MKKTLIASTVLALSFALPVFASEITGTLSAGTNAPSSSATPSSGSLSGSVSAPATTASSPAAASVGNGPPVGLMTTPTPITPAAPNTGQVLGTSTPTASPAPITPGAPNTGAGGERTSDMLTLIVSGIAALWGFGRLARPRIH